MLSRKHIASEPVGLLQIINRVQKLRKKAGLLASDAVDVYIGSSEDSKVSTSGRDSPITRVLEAQVCHCALDLSCFVKVALQSKAAPRVWQRLFTSA